MLIKLKVENFKSFNNVVELSMLTSNKTRKLDEHKITENKVNLLKNAVIYGANASGKSNLIEVFHFLKYCFAKAIPAESNNLFCKTKEENKSRPSSFELTFTIGKKTFAYGFSAVLSERRIIEEWLYELSKNTSKLLFDCKENSTPTLGIKDINEDDKVKFNTYASDYKGRNATLFLNELNRNKKYSSKSKLSIFKEVYEWLTNNIIILKPDTSLTNFSYFYDNESVEKVKEWIKAFDTGISDARIEKITMDELKSKLPSEVVDAIYSKMKECIEDDNKKDCQLSMRAAKEFFSIRMDNNQEPIITTIKLKHSNSFYDFDFNEESDGTCRLFDLIDMLLMKKDNIVFIVDELERSLHPKLTQNFLKLFNQVHKDRKVQLLFTTHEASIMDQKLFRRDEIWFVERDFDSASKLYSLDRFSERYDKKLSKAYLEGRYGAIPVFSTLKEGEENDSV